MQIIDLSSARATTAQMLAITLLAALSSQSAVAEPDGAPRRPPSFTYREVQSKITPPGATETGSKGGPNAKTIASTASQENQRGRIGGGRATFYQHSGRTASGERYNPDGMTAAHHSLPIGSRVRVVNESNGRSAIVRINDRTNQKTNAKHPYAIDLSRGSARAIGISNVGNVAIYRAD